MTHRFCTQSLILLFVSYFALVFLGFAQEPPMPSQLKPPTELKIESPIKGWGQRFVDWAVGLMTGKGENSIRVYFPALSTDPNSGATLGALPIWLLQDQQKNIRHIIAPSLTYNGTFGITPTFRYYYYPHPDAQFFVIGSKSQTSDERVTLRYTDPRWMDFLYLKTEFSHEIDGSLRFFGIGSQSPHSAESTYSLNELKALVNVGLDLPWHFLVLWTNSFRQVSIDEGPLSIPQIRTTFPNLVPNGHTLIVSEGLNLAYDTRNSQVTPTQGLLVEIFGQVSPNAMGSDSEFARYGFEARGYIPHRDGQMVSALRYMYRLETGDAPFFEQFWLGGDNELRGYGDGRFVDRGISIFNFEERIRFYRMRAFGVNTDFEFTPFFDLGSVFPKASDMPLKGYHPVGGFGVRAAVKPTVVGSVDVGYGDEGTATFVGIDYPF